MKKLILPLLIIFLTGNFVYADDLWDNFGDSNVYGQKPVTDAEFEKAYESKKGKPRKAREEKNFEKGKTYSQSNETEILNNTAKELPVLLIPVNLKIKDGYIVPVGHYQVEGVKDKDGEVYIKLYQAHDVIAKIPAEETEDDFGEETINFVKLNPHGDYHVEILYGGIDFNAFAIIDVE